MGLNLYNIKKWTKMIMGNSILHVNQGIGRIYSKTDVLGYYNDLTEKVLKGKDYKEVKLPLFKIGPRREIHFPIEIFQYGLGAYDLYLMEKKDLYLKKFKLCVDFAIKNQLANGAWKTFDYYKPDNPYSSMAQGEGTSLLIRAYNQYGDEKYLTRAKKAIDFMLTSVVDGGTTQYDNDDIFLQEYTDQPTVLNGWIFSLFGLYDYLKVDNNKNFQELYTKSINTMINRLDAFDNGYWSMYDIKHTITSPFYHKLHIAQLDVLYAITNEEAFKHYARKWSNYLLKRKNRYRAFIKKACQKLIEK